MFWFCYLNKLKNVTISADITSYFLENFYGKKQKEQQI